MINALHGPAAESSAFASGALETLAALSAVPHYRWSLLKQGAVDAISGAICWHAADSHACKKACDALCSLALAWRGNDCVSHVDGSMLLDCVWPAVLKPALTRHGADDAVAASALRAGALLVITQRSCDTLLAGEVRAVVETIIRREGVSSEVVKSGSLLLAALHLTSVASQPEAAGTSDASARSAAATRVLCTLPRYDRSQSANACALLAISAHDCATVAAIAAGPAARSVDWKAALELAAHTGQGVTLDVVVEHIRAVEMFLDGSSSHDAAHRALCIAVSHGDSVLVHHLLKRWNVKPTWECSAAFWLAAEQRSVDLLHLLIDSPAMAAAADGGSHCVVDLSENEGQLDLLERLMLRGKTTRSRRSLSLLRLGDAAGAADAELDADETRDPTAVAIVQRMLLDTHRDPEAAGLQALEAAAQQKRLFILQALLEDVRADPLPFASERLTAEPPLRLDACVRSMLMRQPAVARAVALPATISYSATDVAAMCAGAWRRRRAAMLAWMCDDSE